MHFMQRGGGECKCKWSGLECRKDVASAQGGRGTYSVAFVVVLVNMYLTILCQIAVSRDFWRGASLEAAG